MRIGLIGCGYISRTHLLAWRYIPEAEVVAVCDTDESKRKVRQREFGIASAFASVEAMLAGAELDALDICTPPASHLALVEAGAGAGKHLLVQKPLAFTVEEAEAMCQAAERAGVVLAVKENFRWLPWFRAMRQAVADGVVGKVRRVQLQREAWGSPNPDWQVWQEQGYFRTMERALWFDVGVHMIDILRLLLGDPDSIYAAMVRLSPLMVGEDVVHVVLRYPGHFATCDMSWAVRGAPSRSVERARVEGTLASLELKVDGTLMLRDNHGGWRTLAVDCSDANLASHRASQENFIHGVGGTQELATPGRDNARTLAISLAAYASAHDGQAYPC